MTRWLNVKLPLILVLAVGFLTQFKSEPIQDSLMNAYANKFFIGTALNSAQIREEQPSAAILIPKQFNTITAENIMKCEVIHPEWTNYNFEMADKFVAYGEKNKMFIVGHTLIWHSQLATFVRKIKNRDSLLLFMTNHINTVAVS